FFYDYRFYSDDSTFIHGPLDKPGQNRELYCHGHKQINNKIMSLNFSNCHTKVRQVDSMRTLGNGIVIQIVGDLSNNRQPSRRFHQTIVLAPESPNKYYVRNDLFRYQDDVTDGMTGGDHQNNIQMLENGDSQSLVAEIMNEMNQKPEISKNEPGVIDLSNREENFQPAKQQQLVNNTNANNNNGELVDISKMMTSGDEAKGTSVQPTDKAIMGSPTTPTQLESNETIPQQMKMVPNSDKSAAVAVGTENLKHSDEDLVKSESKPEQQESNENNNLDESPKTSVFPSASNEPKTYAGILGRGSGHQSSMAAAVPVSTSIGQTSKNLNEGPVNAGNVAINVPLPPLSSSENSIVNVMGTNSGGPLVPKPPFTVNAPSTQHQQFTAPLLNQQRERDHRFPKKSYNRRNDSREKIVHTIFGKYGKIVDVRINRQKMPNSGKGRNYGFITFEDPQVVDKIIAQKPIYHENHRYNVEKKQGKASANTGSSNYD
ncbi:ras GTPase-activating protein-binding-like protein, partial [Euroglyphus maynei]